MDPQEIPLTAFKKLYPQDSEESIPRLSLRYSGKFSDYNGNVSMVGIRGRRGEYSELKFSLSKKFFDVDEDIQIGMIQHLLNKVYKTNVCSLEQDLYENFIKHLTRYADRRESDSSLVKLFNELNEEYFFGTMDQPNLVFGQDSVRTLGHYNYAKDLVTISKILRDDVELMRFVLYHELLHKKHGFKKSKTGRSQYHTTAFRKDERAYADYDSMEKRLTNFVSKKRIKNYFKWF